MTRYTARVAASRKTAGARTGGVAATGVPAAAGIMASRDNATCSCGGGCPRCQDQSPPRSGSRVRAADDAYEREADRMANRMLAMPDPAVSGAAWSGGGGKPARQRVAGTGGDPRYGAGKPLSSSERDFFEPRLGMDLGGVRIHDDERAARAARSINARAFTVGGDVVFGMGQHAPDRASGRRLLAHELTHVAQQADASGPRGVQRDPDTELAEEVAAFSVRELERALTQGYVWGFEIPVINGLTGPRRARILRCRANQLWRLVRLLRSVAGAHRPDWRPEFAGLAVSNTVGELIERDIWEPIRCGSEEYPGRYRDYIGARADDTLVRVPPAFEQQQLPRPSGEHPEVEVAASVSLMNIYRYLVDNPDDPRFRDYLIDAAVLELVVRDRQEQNGGTSDEGRTTLRLEGDDSPFTSIFSDASPIALSLVISDDNLLRELESMPDEEALRFLQLLGTQLTGLAMELMDSDSGFRREVMEALRRFREQLRRYRRRHRYETPLPEGTTRTG